MFRSILFVLMTLFTSIFAMEYRPCSPCCFFKSSQKPKKETELTTSCYIDMGILYGNYVVGECIVWWPEPVHIDQDKIDAFLDEMFTQLKKDGADLVALSFAQISDIDALLNSQAGSAEDTITVIQTDNYPVGSTSDNFLTYFIQKAHSYEIKVALSFGGAIATEDDMKIQGDASTQADHLVQFLQKYDIDAVDFDIEGTGLAIMSVNSQLQVKSFLSALHGSLSENEHTSTLTLEGSIQNGPAGSLAPLFEDLDTYFDGVNLMLYSTTQYYLDANNVTWGIHQWLQYVTKASMLHVGFYDAIPYEDPAASAGEKYDVPSDLTRGQAAAFVYLQVMKDLEMSAMDFGSPFYWTDDPTTISKNEFMQDFYSYLEENAQAKR